MFSDDVLNMSPPQIKRSLIPGSTSDEWTGQFGTSLVENNTRWHVLHRLWRLLARQANTAPGYSWLTHQVEQATQETDSQAYKKDQE
jgi:hypothetical protein